MFEEEKKSLRRVTKIQKEIWVRPRRTIIRNRGDTNCPEIFFSLLLYGGRLELKAKKKLSNLFVWGFHFVIGYSSRTH